MLPPENPGGPEICWRNIVVAQCACAALGSIPELALAFGVEVNGFDVQLRFQLSEVQEEDLEDIDSIVSELEALL